jgi:hypothetical protein
MRYRTQQYRLLDFSREMTDELEKDKLQQKFLSLGQLHFTDIFSTNKISGTVFKNRGRET